MKWIKLSVLMLLCFGLHAQEQIVPATILTAPITWTKSQANQTLAKTGETLPLPFIDDFSVDRFPENPGGYTALWEQRNATRNTGWGLNPPTLGVVSFDGANALGMPYSFGAGSGFADTLTSNPINIALNPDDGVGLSFYYQPKGNAYFPPSSGDSLFLEFYAPNLDQWFHVWGTNNVLNTENFTFVYVPIQLTHFLVDGFQFRFRNRASLQGALDTWNIDYIWLDQNSNNAQAINNDVAFVRQESTFLLDYTAMPRDHYAINPAQHMRPSITTSIHNLNNTPRTLEGNKIRISYDGSVLGDYPNVNSPAILPGATIDYQHNVLAPPNNIIFDPSMSDTRLDYKVELIHGVADFLATASNDTNRFVQQFFTHYSYDDGSAEAAYAVPTNGAEVALKYTSYKSDSIFAIQIYTMPLGFNQANSSFTVRIWESSGIGPGNLIHQSLQTLAYGDSEYQESIIYVLEEPIFVPMGDFFVGYRQTNQNEGIRVGIDFNTNANQGRLYFKEATSWVGSQFSGSVMIRPMFTSTGYEELLLSTGYELEVPGLKLYPNPANSYFQLSASVQTPMQVDIYDLMGRRIKHLLNIQSGASISTEDMEVGIYLVVVQAEAGQRSTKKLMVTR